MELRWLQLCVIYAKLEVYLSVCPRVGGRKSEKDTFCVVYPRDEAYFGCLEMFHLFQNL